LLTCSGISTSIFFFFPVFFYGFDFCSGISSSASLIISNFSSVVLPDGAFLFLVAAFLV